MTAEVLDPPMRFSVVPALRDDGSYGPPLRISYTIRPCWRKPPQKFELLYLYELDDVAYYGVERA